MKSLLGRADLARLLRAGGHPNQAAALGFGYREKAPQQQRQSVTPATGIQIAEQPLDPVPLAIPTHFELIAGAEIASSDAEPARSAKTWEETRPRQNPAPIPIGPERDLVGRMAQRLFARKADGPFDYDAAVKKIARLEILQRLPRRPRRCALSSVSLIVDRSNRLAPFHEDFLRLATGLAKRFAKGEFIVAQYSHEAGYFTGQDADASYYFDRPRADRPCIFLGDLGGPAGDLWRDLGKRLRHNRQPAVALCPFPPNIGMEEAESWRIGTLDNRLPPHNTDQLLERLAVFLSPAVRLEPALIRAIRKRFLPECGAWLEAAFWNSSVLESNHPIAATTARQHLPDLRHDFLKSPKISNEQRRDAIDIIRSYRGEIAEEIYFEEIIGLGRDAKHWLSHPGDIDAASRFFAGFSGGGAGSLSDQAWLSRVADRLEKLEAPWQNPKLRKAIFALKADDPSFKPNIDPNKAPPTSRPIGTLRFEQRIDELRIAAPDTTPAGSLITTLPSANGRYKIEPLPQEQTEVRPEWGQITPNGPPARLPLPSEPFIIRTDLAKQVIDRISLEGLDWANAVGRDRYGLWAEIKVDKVRQRLRWIPPGRFLMGSPEDESGRFDDEGPQQQISFVEGFWLFDTTVTQSLFEVVMGTNTSKFISSDRPVEQVSWNDAKTFLSKLNSRIAGLKLHLPSEAAWEYACRAGTTTATYVGSLEIFGEYNAPMLDAIAWYGGNSGRDFDLDIGLDSSDWPGSQYADPKGGTRQVALKDPNAWGLYDMLGNVWEWCEDAGSESHEGADFTGIPRFDSEQDAPRVFRGGSWISTAIYLRAAVRGWSHPDNRNGNLGFRAALG